MSKRNKKMRSNRSAFKLEALEQRQLLATISGGGASTDEVGSNITVSGKVYDQVLMKTSTISVAADPGQIVRIDFLDVDGDVIRAEFSGAGTLNVSLANFVDAATAAKYNIPNVKYVQGLASFTITGSDGTSNFSTYSLGVDNVFTKALNPIFSDPTKQGGNHNSNVARLVIVGDPANPVSGLGSNFGSILAGNAIFADSSGVIGIFAKDTSFKTGSTIVIGDIVPSGTATPTIQLGAFSDVKTVTIAGGSLPGGGNNYIFSNVTRMTSGPGTDSAGTKLDTKTLANSNGTVTYTSGVGTLTIDAATATQATFDAYKGSYLTDVTVTGSLNAGMVFRALQFGTLTITGNLAGVVTTDVNNNNASDGSEQGIGNITINGNILEGGYIESATSIGNVTVGGTTTHAAISPLITVSGNPLPVADYQAVISTIGRGGQSAAIGNVSFGGDVNLTAAEGLIISGLKSLATNGLGNTTASGSTTGGIGTISGVNLTANTGAAAIPIIGNFVSGAGIGNMTFTGDVSLTNTDATTVVGGATPSTGSDAIFSARNVGNIQAKSLTISDAGNAIRATNINSTTVTQGTIGNISTTTGNLTISKGNILAQGSIGSFTVGGSGSLLLGSAGAANVTATAGNIGDIIVNAGALTLTAGNASISAGSAAGPGAIGNITVGAGDLNVGAGSTITATGGNIGNILLSNTGTSTIGAQIKSVVQGGVGGAIGNVTVTAGNLALTAAGKITGGTSVGNITLNAGTLGFIAAGAQISAATSIGNVTVGGRIVGVDANVEFTANSIGNVSVTGRVADSFVIRDVNFQAKGTTAATIGTAKIGDITLNTTANNAGDVVDTTGFAAGTLYTGQLVIGAAAAGDAATDGNSGTGFSSSGNIGNISITTGTAAGAEIIDGTGSKWGSLLFRAGSSEFGEVTSTLAGNKVLAIQGTASSAAVLTLAGAATTDAVETVSIGNVSITGNLSTGSNLAKGNVAGTGLIIASGVQIPAAAGGSFRETAAATNGNPLNTPIAQTSGSIGALTLSDVSGNVVRTPFSNANLNDVTSNDNGGSIIIADKIASITINSGPGAILSLPSLSGLPLRGAIGDGGAGGAVPNTANQEVQGSAVAINGLVIVVL